MKSVHKFTVHACICTVYVQYMYIKLCDPANRNIHVHNNMYILCTLNYVMQQIEIYMYKTSTHVHVHLIM